ncbi:uncharacterized protein LOC113862314 [Abrus precatorius]|uniref:Uncharacterized protein LOC113862314 n=1 Tax=Abrus precatorius TaxID=3816 RepID=A0A8B8L4I5_ABRPR|nr:uncharacterized protein LOC113862314 [Abrus precatorius]
MDKSWIDMPRNTPQYVEGLNSFLNFAFANRSVEGGIICPCPKCKFNRWKSREEVYDHLIVKPFLKGYTVWLRHGEISHADTIVERPSMSREIEDRVIASDPICDMVNDIFRNHISRDDMQENDDICPQSNQALLDNNAEFLELIRDGQQTSDKAMSMILELLADAFEHANIPSSFYEAKKTIAKLGLNYTKIHACLRDCMLYFGEDANRDTCKTCKQSRWKSKDKGANTNTTDKQKKVLAKVLRYFPLKPHLQRLFMSSKTAEHMQWHGLESTTEGILRHPRDSEAWKKFDLMYPQFASDSRNVRLGLATNGFNPFRNLSTSYSIWPVMLIPYNLPPWMYMKQSSFILSMIILGKQAPRNDIDVYLQPLLEELKDLWTTGVRTFDSYSNEVFNMHEAVMWTISDFPGLGTLSGLDTYTGLVCPTCNFDSVPSRLPHSRKWCFMGHRRSFNEGHKFRLARSRFDGNVENRNPPVAITGASIWQQVQMINVVFGKDLDVEGRAKKVRRVGGTQAEPSQ